uniref:NADH-ubiquinone oxidoreductase chain 3 n=1 Tax=Sphindus dubius TaxID=295944 RepID=A0A0S2MQQ5_9CUCU|nr:NADH deshydrogenase subunit 3 [Sphindus dubius]
MIKSLYMSIFLIFLIITLMTIMLNLISSKKFLDREKSSPFECGFNPMSTARLPFSLSFFLVAIIFLIFDVEITLIIPMIKSFMMINMFSYYLMLTFFIIILIMGLYHEWSQGALNWKI